MLRRAALQCGTQVGVARCGAAAPSSWRLLHACANHRSSLLAPASSMVLPHPAPYQRPYRTFAAATSSAPSPSPPQLDEDSRPKQDEEAAATAEATAAPEPPAPLFSCPAPRFFRLLAGASMTQIAFWTSYSFLPPELSGNMGYWGILGSGAFVFIARHFAMHYVWEVDVVSPVAFRVNAHTFWGNKGPERIVQVGTTQMQHTSRYMAFKCKGDSFWYLLDIKEGKFGSDDDKDLLMRMFQGLRVEVPGRGLDAGGAGGAHEDGQEGHQARRGGRGRRWKGGYKKGGG